MLHSWADFFDITSAAGAQLIGLMFVVVTLGNSLSKSQSVVGIRAFITPKLICFSGVFFQGLVVLAPWKSDWPIGFMLALIGLVGAAYHITRTIRRASSISPRSTGSTGIAHNGLPVVANASLICGAAGLIAEKPFAPYAVAGATTLLLISGVYGAWDLTLWMVADRHKP